jgi:hypothetical protein
VLNRKKDGILQDNNFILFLPPAYRGLTLNFSEFHHYRLRD